MAEFLGGPVEKTWGIVLDKKNANVVWPSEVADGDEMKLELSQATLGAGAKAGERNIVEISIISEDNSEETQTFPIVSLREGLSEHTLLNLTINPPASFRLIAGSGPISIMGVQHNITDDTSDSERSDDEQLVKPESTTQTKKRKLESPATEAKKPKVQTDKVSPVKKSKADFTKQEAKDTIMKMMGGEDSDDDSNEDMDEFTPSDSDDADDDGKNGFDDESMSDGDDDDKVVKPEPGVKNAKAQKVTKPKPAAKPADTKTTAKGSKASPAAIEAVKAKIRANKSLPKSEEKFKNYAKSLKVSDAGQVSELWKFVQQIRKP